MLHFLISASVHAQLEVSAANLKCTISAGQRPPWSAPMHKSPSGKWLCSLWLLNQELLKQAIP